MLLFETCRRSTGMRDIRRTVWRLALCLLAWLALQGSASAGDPTHLQAEFLSKVSAFITWPEGTFSSPDDAIVVGVVAGDEFGGIVADVFAGKKARKRPYKIKVLAGIEQAGEVHMFIVPSSGDLAKHANALKDVAVVSVAPSFEFAKAGGVLALEPFEEKVAFEINNKTAMRLNLKFSSRILQIASTVY